jgi:hypothetical protein
MEENSIYANSIGIAMSQNDCCITFKMLIPHEPNNGSSLTVKSDHVILSPSLARQLEKMLQIQLERYEATYGPIKELNLEVTTSANLKKGEKNGKK